jgi:hypothetical protein
VGAVRKYYLVDSPREHILVAAVVSLTVIRLQDEDGCRMILAWTCYYQWMMGTAAKHKRVDIRSTFRHIANSDHCTSLQSFPFC